jgi:tRNA(fMet)-specific endonuclease VapC
VRFILDTNAASALMKGHAAFLARLAGARKEEVAIPQPVLAELAYGIERLPRSKRKERLRERYELIRGELARAPWTDLVSESFGAIKALLERRGQRIEDFDAAIAAHAIAHQAVLVTADRSHMPRVPGLVIEDWTRAVR